MRICDDCGATYPNDVRICPADGCTLGFVTPTEGVVVADRYALKKKLGAGGMGVVFKAEQLALKRPVALKFLLSRFTDDPIALKRFQREARATSSIHHDGIVSIIDFGDDPEYGCFYTMEYIEGDSLQTMIDDQGALPLIEATRIGLVLSDALAAAHLQGVVHRDLKPENIILSIGDGDGGDTVPKILDFGVAAFAGDEDEKLTATGQTFGSPRYMSPEQAAGEETDPRTDVYALGVILFEMFTGRLPFTAANLVILLVKHMREVPPPPSSFRGDLPPAIERIILRCLEKDPEQRWASMGALRDALSVEQRRLQRTHVGFTPPPQLVPEPSHGLEPAHEAEPEHTLDLAPELEPPPHRSRPYLFIGLLALAAFGGMWVVGQLRQPSTEQAPDRINHVRTRPPPAAAPVVPVEVPVVDASVDAAAPDAAPSPKIKVVRLAPTPKRLNARPARPKPKPKPRSKPALMEWNE